MAIEVTINGENRCLQHSRTVDELMRELDLEPSTVLIEVDGVALLRSEWSATSLESGAKVEVLRVAAGG